MKIILTYTYKMEINKFYFVVEFLCAYNMRV